MKIKNDFITNSSSCSYVVFIPDNFDIDKFIDLIDDERLKEPLSASWNEYNLKTINDVKVKIKEKINRLIKNGYIYHDDWIYYIIGELLEDLDLIIDEPETGGGDGSGCMINISGAPIREKLKTILSGGWGIKQGGWGSETKI